MNTLIPPPLNSLNLQEAPVIVVGAGTSGLATSACLNRRSIHHILLEREDCYASLWHKYSYDRVHLHLRKEFCHLPHMPFPSSYPHYVPKKQFLHYLDHYVNHFHIHPTFNRAVELAHYEDAHHQWRVRARNRNSGQVEDYAGRFLVVASGETAEPRVPEIQGLDTFEGKVLHSTGYKNGKEFQDKRVLVVGSGNSGMEIALDLANYGARPSIIVRSPVHILTRDMMHYASVLLSHLPFSTVENLLMISSRIVFGDLTKYGIPWPNEGPLSMKLKYGKFPVIDVGTVQKIKSGEIQVLGEEIERIRGKEVVFKDGKSLPFESIVFCTGFKRSTHKWLKGGEDVLDEEGLANSKYPNHWKGKNGLYFVGLAQRGFVGARRDAENIAIDISSVLQSQSQGIKTHAS